MEIHHPFQGFILEGECDIHVLFFHFLEIVKARGSPVLGRLENSNFDF